MRVKVNNPMLVSSDLAGTAFVGDLHDAMEQGKTISFIYDSKPRTVEVHAVGTSTKDGGLVMRGVQVAGGSSRPLPQWALFRLDRMSGVSIDFTVSGAPRSGYTMGDSQMDVILAELDVG